MKGMAKKGFLCSILMMTFVLLCNFTMAEAAQRQSLDQVQKAAKKKVPGARIMEVDTDMENGILVYEVELRKGNKEYTLQYRASNGKLVKYEWELNSRSHTSQSGKNLSKKTIQKKAKRKVKNAAITSTTLTYDDGMAQYKVCLKKGKKSYVLLYHSKNGKLIDYQWKISTKTSKSAAYIGTAKAKSIALKKVPGATIIKVEFDKEDGVAVYEVSMVKGIYEYEVTINAKSGKILEYDRDIDD